MGSFGRCHPPKPWSNDDTDPETPKFPPCEHPKELSCSVWASSGTLWWERRTNPITAGIWGWVAPPYLLLGAAQVFLDTPGEEPGAAAPALGHGPGPAPPAAPWLPLEGFDEGSGRRGQAASAPRPGTPRTPKRLPWHPAQARGLGSHGGSSAERDP